MNRLQSIIEGWENLIFKNKESEKIALDRAIVCSECDQNKKEWCRECNCYIPAKIRSRTEECPLNFW